MPHNALSYVVRLGAAACIIAGGPVAASHAQDADRGTVFQPEEFARFAPRTALDMVSQIPGFSINDGNSGARGFGQASANVLINGQRVSGKSNGVRDALGRLPAANVVSLRLVDASMLDVPGLSGLVVDVTARASDGISGSWAWEGLIRENLKPVFDDIDVSLAGGQGTIAWSLNFESNPDRGARSGPERVFDATGNRIELRDEDFTYIGSAPQVSGSLAWTRLNGDLANLTASYALNQFEVKEVSKRFTEAGPAGTRLFQRSEDEWNTEIGADYETGFGPGRLKAIGLMRLEHSPLTNRVRFALADGTGRSATDFNQTVDEGEYILRTEYAFATGAGRDWQMSLEGAFNFLDSDAEFFAGETGDLLVREPLTNASTRVEEQRAEIAVTHTRVMGPRLTVQGSVGAEVSELSQSGNAGQVRQFTRPKGYLQATWQQSPRLTYTGRLSREVGQLNFFDFISSVNLEIDRDNVGNPEIVPQQAWRLEGTIERDLGAWGAATLEAYVEDIEDRVDQIPIGDGDGPGNIASARRARVELTSTLRLDPMGHTGGQVELELEAGWSELDDPVTGQSRRFNGDLVTSAELEYRRDIPKTDWAYGIGVEYFRGAADFSFDEISRETENPGAGFVFIQHKDIYGMTGFTGISNIFNERDVFRREIFEPSRTGALSRVEDRDQKFGPRFFIGLEGSF